VNSEGGEVKVNIMGDHVESKGAAAADIPKSKWFNL
jgi:hypothetical protein